MLTISEFSITVCKRLYYHEFQNQKSKAIKQEENDVPFNCNCYQAMGITIRHLVLTIITLTWPWNLSVLIECSSYDVSLLTKPTKWQS